MMELCFKGRRGENASGRAICETEVRGKVKLVGKGIGTLS